MKRLLPIVLSICLLISFIPDSSAYIWHRYYRRPYVCRPYYPPAPIPAPYYRPYAPAPAYQDRWVQPHWRRTPYGDQWIPGHWTHIRVY